MDLNEVPLPDRSMPRGSIRNRILWSAATLIIVGTIILGWFFWKTVRENHLQTQSLRIVNLLQNKEKLFLQHLHDGEQDITFLSKVPTLHQLVNLMSSSTESSSDVSVEAARQRLAKLFLALAAAHPNYVQLRLIGLADQGREVVRVERAGGRPRIVDTKDLQRKGDRDYVQIGEKLLKGQVYLSPIGLNYEHGKVQVPHIRTQRLITPVFDSEGRRFGMLVINVDIGPFLDGLTQDATDRALVFLANARGDFLVHPDETRTFGFDLGHRYLLSNDLADLRSIQGGAPDTAGTSDNTFPMRSPELTRVNLASGAAYAMADRLYFDPLDPSRYLTLVVAITEKQINQAVLHRVGPMIGGLIAISLLLMGLVIVMLHRMLAPLHNMTQLARRIGRGEYDFELPEAPVGELSVLLSAFSDMRNGIQHREQENAALTGQLQASENFAKAVIDAMPDGVLVIDEAGRIVKTNENASELFGYSVAELTRLTVEDLIPERYRGGHVALRQGFARDPQNREMGRGLELFALRKDGSEFPVDVGLGPMQQQGRQYVTVVLADVSERKADEAALKASEERFRLMTSNIRDYAIFMLDPSGNVLNWNPGSERLYGYGAEEIVGQNFTRLSAPEDTEDGTTAGMLAQARQQGVAETESWQVRRDGTRFCAQVALSAIEDEAGELKGYVRIDRDLTEHKQAEGMRISRDAADAANRAKSEFLANMSHEIRTPLNGILGLARLLQDTPLSNSQRDYLNKLLDSSNALLRILNDILDFAKIESGRVELEPVSFDLDDLLDTSISLFSFNAEQKGLELLLDVAPCVPLHLHGDSLRLSQVLNNLIGNAVKFTDQGSVQVSVSADMPSEADEGNSVLLHFRVQDTGIGMTSAQLKKLFQAFQQADASITRRYGGSGLGLVIAQHLITLMGGEIDVTSTAGEGSSFWFTVRMVRESERCPHPSREPGQLRPMKVLVVDDNPTSVSILTEMLQNWGLEVAGAYDAESGLTMARSAQQKGVPFELFLIDWKMPGMDGIAMAEQIHDMVSRKEIAQMPMLILATAFGHEYVHRTSKLVHLDALLEKPVTPSRLFDLIISIQNQLKPDLAEIPENMGESLYEQTAAIHGARVLLVEDNPTNQFIARAFLEKMGLVVDLAENGQQAVDQLMRFDYDIVLMDLQMPVMDGLEACRRIRQMPKGKQLPIVAMTAAAQRSDRALTESVGMNGHITKPIDIELLRQALLTWIPPREDGERPKDHATGLSLDQSPDFASDGPGISNAFDAAALHCDASGSDLPTSAARANEGAFEVPGLDLRAAVADLGGDWVLMRRVLSGFLRDFGQVASKMDMLIEQAEWDEACRVAHTVKGLSRTIGAHLLFEAARDLESLLKEPDAQRGSLEAAHAIFTRQVVTVLDRITQSTGTGGQSGAESSKSEGDQRVSDAERLRALRELGSLLHQSVIVSHERKDELLRLLKNRVDKVEVQTLFQLVSELDYEAAEAVLARIIQTIEG
ncbi:hypothetical protein A9404_00065 [Halothiobacillus diazotrophicus]|uniref:Sensory/regulatory protein RpfC n=1 Tax=Halothiobacillus diazotrophicus TaxID=1860122 RepID=A0A191ZDP3_9GAMM|nr:PAS domain S-box protein [Halothiobacillus diazotrophicus]ANJ65988.1 hypothetical protein A9404_00065 [Halothiobacillus diazotrophicus]